MVLVKFFIVFLFITLSLSGCATGPAQRHAQQGQVHVVKSGDTLYGLARQYKVPLKSLIDANSLSAPDTIRVGQKLRIPGRGNVKVAKAPVKSTPQLASRSTSAATPAAIPTEPIGETESPYLPEIKTHASNSRFAWPVRGKVLQGYGEIKEGVSNEGINIAAPVGTAVLAAGDGTVVYADDGLRGYGKLILIKHADGWVTAYAHNETLLVKKGDKIKKSQAIAKVGQTGNVSRPQLHFEVRKGQETMDPIGVLGYPG